MLGGGGLLGGLGVISIRGAVDSAAVNTEHKTHTATLLARHATTKTAFLELPDITANTHTMF